MYLSYCIAFLLDFKNGIVFYSGPYHYRFLMNSAEILKFLPELLNVKVKCKRKVKSEWSSFLLIICKDFASSFRTQMYLPVFDTTQKCDCNY